MLEQKYCERLFEMFPDGLSKASAVPVGDHWHGSCHFSGLLTGWPVLSVWPNMGSLIGSTHYCSEREMEYIQSRPVWCWHNPKKKDYTNYTCCVSVAAVKIRTTTVTWNLCRPLLYFIFLIAKPYLYPINGTTTKRTGQNHGSNLNIDFLSLFWWTEKEQTFY